jgi:hypothetical protein
MSTTRIKEKISKLVSSQLPEFIQSDYTTFVTFLEAYYQFLEQDRAALELVQNARSYNDIDETTEDFVQYFINVYAKDIPLDAVGNKRLLIKKIKDLYESKGSSLSFDLLFNLLFQTTVSIEYPYQYILRASDGNWQQRNSLRILTVSGDRSLILNRSLLYTTSGQDFSTPIIDVKNLTSTLTEVFLDPNRLASSYTIGDSVEVRNSSSVIFSGIIDRTLTSYSISRPGIGFKAGQIYTINYGGGTGSLIRVSNVSSTGGITGVKFITFGSGYPNNIFTIDLDPTKTVSETADILSSRTQGFQSFGNVLRYDPTDSSRYFLETYVTPDSYVFTSSTAFSNNVFTAAVTGATKPDAFASIQFTPGALGRYPGSYVSNEGLISELDIRLENNLLYQPFAYQTNTDIDITKFFDIVTQLVHPAGQRLFNNRLLIADIDLNANVSVVATANISTELYDSFDTSEFHFANISKVETDSVTSVEQAILQVSLAISDAANAIEEASISINKTITDNVTMANPGNVVYTQDLRYFLEDYVSELYDENIVNVTNITIS